jgi:hypothetical protein
MIAWNVGNETVVINESALRDICINWKTRVVLLTYGDDEWRKFEGVSLVEMEALSIMFGAKAIDLEDKPTLSMSDAPKVAEKPIKTQKKGKGEGIIKEEIKPIENAPAPLMIINKEVK